MPVMPDSNFSSSYPFFPADRPVFHGFHDLRRLWRESQSASSPHFLPPPRFVSSAFLLTSLSPKTPHFRPFPARQASPTLGRNGSQDVPGGLTPCRFGTQQPWLAPQNSLACSSYPISRPNGTTRSVGLTSTMRHPPTKSPSGFIFMSVPFERSSATSLATPTSTRSSPPPGLVARHPRNVMPSTSGPANSAAKGPPWPTSAPRFNGRGSTSANRISSGSSAARAWPRLAKVVRYGNREIMPTTVPSCPTSPTPGRWSSRTDGNSPPKWPASSCSFPSY